MPRAGAINRLERGVEYPEPIQYMVVILPVARVARIVKGQRR